MKNLIFISIFLLILSGCSYNNIFKREPAVADYVQSAPSMDYGVDINNINVSTSVKYFKNDNKSMQGQIDINKFKNEMLKMLNDIRSHQQYCGGPAKPLKWNKILENAASAHAKDLALNNYLAHNGSGTEFDVARDGTRGSKFYERISYFGYPVKRYTQLGETATLTKNKTPYSSLYINFKTSLKSVLKDPPHCKILMSNRFDFVGVGVYKSYNKYYFIMDFAQR